MGTVCCSPVVESPLATNADGKPSPQQQQLRPPTDGAPPLTPQAVAHATSALLQALRAPSSCTVGLWTREVAAALSEQVFSMQRALASADCLDGSANDGAPLQPNRRGGTLCDAADDAPRKGLGMVMDLHYFVVFDPGLFEPEDDSVVLPREAGAPDLLGGGGGSIGSVSSSDLNNLDRESDDDFAFDRSAVIASGGRGHRVKRGAAGRGSHRRKNNHPSAGILSGFAQLVSQGPRSPVVNARPVPKMSVVAVRAAHCSATSSSLDPTFLAALIELIGKRAQTADATSDPTAAAACSTGSRRHSATVPATFGGGPAAPRYGHCTLPLPSTASTGKRASLVEQETCSVIFASHACAVRDRQRYGTNITACRKGVAMEGTVVVWRQRHSLDRQAALLDDQDRYDDVFCRQATTEGVARSIFQRVVTLAR